MLKTKTKSKNHKQITEKQIQKVKHDMKEEFNKEKSYLNVERETEKLLSSI